MPTSLEMTHERALSRHPFRNINARATLKTERKELDIKLDTAKCNLTEIKEELVTAGNVVNNNAQEATECEAQIALYDSLITSRPRKTLKQYTVILSQINHYTAIQIVYQPKHNDGQLKLNRIQGQLVTRETAPTDATSAKDGFQTIYRDRKWKKRIASRQSGCQCAI